DLGIGDEAGALLDLVGVLLAHLDFAVGRVPVAQAAATDLAIAHSAYVLNAARLDLDHLAAGIDHLFRIDLVGGGWSRTIPTDRRSSGSGFVRRDRRLLIARLSRPRSRLGRGSRRITAHGRCARCRLSRGLLCWGLSLRRSRR